LQDLLQQQQLKTAAAPQQLLPAVPVQFSSNIPLQQQLPQAGAAERASSQQQLSSSSFLYSQQYIFPVQNFQQLYSFKLFGKRLLEDEALPAAVELVSSSIFSPI
jgi:hypothetical protein